MNTLKVDGEEQAALFLLFLWARKVIIRGGSGVTPAAIHNIVFYLALHVGFLVLLLFGGLLGGLC